ncbi:hypothetical protein VCRA2113O415_490018 [Vibrio crassostreae]|nr:hypothetical protein VCRA2113O415_490018 [Vibrio crassostreae]CAK2875638.1 hypothetical protein VCRA2113O420_450018 [Vibrio crassostreae]CAK3483831.1 hypothetical protein VCRA2121O436_440004 [Vibrio crassostreae]
MQQLVAQINLMLVSCLLSTPWGISEVERATGKNSACDGFGQKRVSYIALFDLRQIRKSTLKS